MGREACADGLGSDFFGRAWPVSVEKESDNNIIINKYKQNQQLQQQ